MNYDAMGQVVPGVSPFAAGVAPMPFANGLYRTDIIGRAPMAAWPTPQTDVRVGSVPQHWDIIGQEGAGGGAMEWLKGTGPLGIKRWALLAGAAAIGATWFAYSRGYLGARDYGSSFYY